MVLRKGKFKPFAGNPKKGVFQTVEFGAGDAEHISNRAWKSPKRKYAAVDPRMTYIEDLMAYKNLEATKQSMEGYIDAMKRSGTKTRHIAIRMPNPKDIRSNDFSIRSLLKEAKHVLLPNGKIFVTTESGYVVHRLVRTAMEEGFSVREPAALAQPKTRVERMMMDLRKKPVYRIELTYKLKTAMPGNTKEAKEKRKHWAEKVSQ